MNVGGSFQIDQTIGSHLKFELNYNLPDKTNPIMKITFPNQTTVDEPMDESLTTMIFSFEDIFSAEQIEILLILIRFGAIY